VNQTIGKAIRFLTASALAIFFSLTMGCVSKPQQDQLYQELGAETGVARLVDAIIVEIKANPKVMVFFQDTNFDYFRDRLIEDICVRSGGACTYQGLSMADAHSGMQIRESEFTYFVEDTQNAMQAVGLSTATQNKLLALLARDRSEIIRQ
jgi:hemoglobin